MTNPNFSIKNPDLLSEALTHRSYLNEHPSTPRHNERLEFLGDAVLELAVSEFLFARYPQNPEGELTAYRASLVCTQTLAQVAAKLNLGDLLRLSKGEAQSGGRTNSSLLANTFEALLGAMYLDQGYAQVVDFLNVHLFPLIDTIIKEELFKDYKSRLQEKVQAKGHNTPEYQLISESGPDREKQFTIKVVVDGITLGEGSGRNKQAAQQIAARQALEKELAD